MLYLLAQTLAARQEGPHNVQVRSKQARPTHMQGRILDEAHPLPFDHRALKLFFHKAHAPSLHSCSRCSVTLSVVL